jgi:ADP-ribosylglycohydrolase
MYEFVLDAYTTNPDKNEWEPTRDAIYQRYQVDGGGGYRYSRPFDAGINFAASLVSLFYGEGDFRRTLQIASLAGWDSDNPAATWGGLLGFILGKDGIERTFQRRFSEAYWIHRTRKAFTDHTPGLAGEDTFSQMAQRGVEVVEKVLTAEE